MSFTGTLDKCKACDKTVHVVDMMTLEGTPYHKSCFKTRAGRKEKACLQRGRKTTRKRKIR